MAAGRHSWIKWWMQMNSFNEKNGLCGCSHIIIHLHFNLFYYSLIQPLIQAHELNWLHAIIQESSEWINCCWMKWIELVLAPLMRQVNQSKWIYSFYWSRQHQWVRGWNEMHALKSVNGLWGCRLMALRVIEMTACIEWHLF